MKDTCSDAASLGRDGLFSLLQIDTGRTFPGRDSLFGFVSAPSLQGPGRAGAPGPCGAHRAMLVRHPQPCPSRSHWELCHQLPGESLGSDSVSRERHGHRQRNEKAAAVTICPFLPGTRAPLAVRVSQEDAPRETAALTAPQRPRWRFLLSTHSALGCPWPPSLLGDFHATVTAAPDSHPPWDPPSLAPLALPGLPSVPSPFPSFRAILFSAAAFSTLSPLLQKKKSSL